MRLLPQFFVRCASGSDLRPLAFFFLALLAHCCETMADALLAGLEAARRSHGTALEAAARLLLANGQRYLRPGAWSGFGFGGVLLALRVRLCWEWLFGGYHGGGAGGRHFHWAFWGLSLKRPKLCHCVWAAIYYDIPAREGAGKRGSCSSCARPHHALKSDVFLGTFRSSAHMVNHYWLSFFCTKLCT